MLYKICSLLIIFCLFVVHVLNKIYITIYSMNYSIQWYYQTLNTMSIIKHYIQLLNTMSIIEHYVKNPVIIGLTVEYM